MPELPEVETIARTLGPQIQGSTIRCAEILQPKVVQSGAQYLPLLAGARVERVWRRAKLLLLTLALSQPGTPPRLANDTRPPHKSFCAKGENPLLQKGVFPFPHNASSPLHNTLFLAFHLKMTGRFFVHPPGAPVLKHTRLILDLTDGSRLFFDDARKFGYCRLMFPNELEEWPFWAQLGPEPLDISAKELAESFAASFAGRRMPIKAALLDQRLVAGIGNIYADEALHKAGIAPTARAGDLPLPKLLALAEALQAVLLQSISQCGSSIRDYRDALGNAGAFQNSFAVYGRKGQPCLCCGRTLLFCRIAGRGSVYCPACQRRG